MNRRAVVSLCVALCLVVPASAQMMQQGPRLRGIWAPQVGAGAAYATEFQGEKRDMEIAIVGKEAAEGKDGHWLETYIKDDDAGEMVIKMLIVMDGENTRPVRMIMKNEMMGTVEMPMQMMNRGRARAENQADISKVAELVGTETVTTPAGTFTCDHYRSKEDNADIWIAKNVAPWGLVKMTSKEGSMTLKRVITGAKTRITEKPTMFDPSAMMRDRP